MFENAKVYTCIIGLSRNNSSFRFAPIKPKQLGSINYEIIPESRLANYTRWDFQQASGSSILDKLKSMPYRLKDIVSVCSQGTVSMGDDLYMLKGDVVGNYFIGYSEQLKKEVRLESGIMRPELKGEDVKRYEPLRNSYWLIYPHHQVNGKTVPYEEHEMQELFPLTYEYLLPYKKELIEKKIRYKTNPKYWYALHRSRDIQMFEQPKIITAEISYGCNMSLDTKGLFHNTKCYTILLKGNFNGKELAYLGLFNSKIMWYFLSETGYVLRGGFFCFKTKYLEPFPIPEIPDDVADLLSKKVQNVLDAKSVDITAETKTIENEINLLVYHLYGLTYDEALIVDPNPPFTREEYEQQEDNDIAEIMRSRPHLFILGAGATKATIPYGDKYGRQSPVMENFMHEIGIDGLLDGVKLETKSNNIEAIYSELASKSEYADVVRQIEDGIVDHYRQMQIPEAPTLYDYLILSLRSKDCIATFNWDPLLIQAYNRVNKITDDLPQMLFLHSCVEVGVCEDCKRYEPYRNRFCSECGKPLVSPRLLYPVKNKDYSQNIYIQDAWNRLQYYLEYACIVTIWGYSAPKSDREAKQMMLKAFSSEYRPLDQIEVIDIADEEVLHKTWLPFAKNTNYHLNIHRSLMDSIIGEFPRRSIEGYVKRYIEGWWNSSTLKLKECSSFDELTQLVTPLIEKESQNNYNVI